MKRPFLVVLAGLAIPLSGCSTFYAEAEQPSVCLTLSPQTFAFPGAGTGGGGVSRSFTGSVDLGLKEVVPDFLLKGPSQDRILHFLSFQVVANPGGNYDFIDDLKIEAVGATGSTPVQLGRYVRGARTNVTSISLPSEAPTTNLSDFLASGGGLSLRVSGNATLPVTQQAWSAQVEACLSAKVRKTLQQMIDGT
jgi:hypothetical protein